MSQKPVGLFKYRNSFSVDKDIDDELESSEDIDVSKLLGVNKKRPAERTTLPPVKKHKPSPAQEILPLASTKENFRKVSSYAPSFQPYRSVFNSRTLHLLTLLTWTWTTLL